MFHFLTRVLKLWTDTVPGPLRLLTLRTLFTPNKPAAPPSAQTGSSCSSSGLTSFLCQAQVVAVPLVGEQGPETEEDEDEASARLHRSSSSHSPVCAGFPVHHLLVSRRQCRTVLAQVDGHLGPGVFRIRTASG